MALTFAHSPNACPECEDDEYVLMDNGVDTNIAIQDCQEHYSVNEYTYIQNKLMSRRCWGWYESFEGAKEAALLHYILRTQS